MVKIIKIGIRTHFEDDFEVNFWSIQHEDFPFFKALLKKQSRICEIFYSFLNAYFPAKSWQRLYAKLILFPTIECIHQITYLVRFRKITHLLPWRRHNSWFIDRWRPGEEWGSSVAPALFQRSRIHILLKRPIFIQKGVIIIARWRSFYSDKRRW